MQCHRLIIFYFLAAVLTQGIPVTGVVIDPFWYTSSRPNPDGDRWNWTLGSDHYRRSGRLLNAAGLTFNSSLSITREEAARRKHGMASRPQNARSGADAPSTEMTFSRRTAELEDAHPFVAGAGQSKHPFPWTPPFFREE
jgi:hypothetical protein